MIHTIRVHRSNGTVKVYSDKQYLAVLAKARSDYGEFYEIEQWYSERKFKSGYLTPVLPSSQLPTPINETMDDCCYN